MNEIETAKKLANGFAYFCNCVFYSKSIANDFFFFIKLTNLKTFLLQVLEPPLYNCVYPKQKYLVRQTYLDNSVTACGNLSIMRVIKSKEHQNIISMAVGTTKV